MAGYKNDAARQAPGVGVGHSSHLDYSTPLAAALCYAELGWHVFPIYEVVGKGCACNNSDCTSQGKHPRTRKGLNGATTDQDQIRKWWDRYPNADVAIRTGALSKLVVIDVDPRHDGDKSLAKLEKQYSSLPLTVEVVSGGGGRHIFLRHPGGTIKNSQSLIGPGLDVKADGGYVVAVPSLHISGQNYKWRSSRGPDEVEVAQIPVWILNLIRSLDRTSSRGGRCKTEKPGFVTEVAETSEMACENSAISVTPDSPLPETIDELIRFTLPKHEGERNSRLLDFARGLKFNLKYEGKPIAELMPLVRRWHEAALPNIRSKNFDATSKDFLHAWDEALFPLGGDPVPIAFERARAKPFPACAQRYQNPDTILLVGACAELQKLVRNRPFFLSCSQVAKALWGDPLSQLDWNQNRVRANRLLKTLERDGVIKCVKRGKKGHAGSPASRYRYQGSLEE